MVKMNEELSVNRASFSFVLGLTLLANVKLYFTLRLQAEADILPVFEISWTFEESLQSNNMNNLSLPDQTKLLYHVNKVISIYCLCIPSFVALDILAIAQRERHLGFYCCYEIIICFWFIQRLTKLF